MRKNIIDYFERKLMRNKEQRMKWYREIGSEDPTKEIIKEIREKKEQEEIAKQEKIK